MTGIAATSTVSPSEDGNNQVITGEAGVKGDELTRKSSSRVYEGKGEITQRHQMKNILTLRSPKTDATGR